MDDIKTRLRETSDKCFTSYESWAGNKKDGTAREALIEAIHELRKVASRLEIELAVSERDEMALKPIPIPPHRDAQRRGGHGNERDFNDDEGNSHRGGRDNNRGHGGGRGGGGGLRGRMGPRRHDNNAEGNGNNFNRSGGDTSFTTGNEGQA